MGRYFIKFSYVGTHYRGIQKNVVKGELFDCDTIQGALESAFRGLLPRTVVPLRTCISSRTDSGVHALCNTAHLQLQNARDTLYQSDNVLRCVNRHLTRCNHSIRLLECIPVTDDFNVRKAILSRTYVYRFMVAKRKDEHRIPIVDSQYSILLSPEGLDIERMRQGVRLFIGKKDFKTFAASSNSNPPSQYVRQLDAFTLEKGHSLIPHDPLSENFDYWQFTCIGKSFLYKQVRRMVGCLFALGKGKITERDIQIMLQVPGHHNFDKRIEIAQSRGLHLAHIKYDLDEVERCTIKDRTENH